jgi:probable HAF family extracellular repeat protein
MLRKLVAPLVAVALVLGLSISASASDHPARYAYTDLGVLGGLDSYAWTLNDRGQVTGHADTSPNSGPRGFHAFLWTPFTTNGTTGSMIDLFETSPADASSIGNGINDCGLVVGESLAADLSTSVAFIYKGSSFDLGSFGGTDSAANGINGRGQVVGYSKKPNGIDQAFLWVPNHPGATKGHMYSLGKVPASIGGVAYAINSGGTVTGFSLDTGFIDHAFVWRPFTRNGTSGRMTALVEPPGATHSSAAAINDSGVIVGEMGLPTGEDHAFVYRTAMHDLGTLAGGHRSFASDINSSGQIVGLSETFNANPHAFIYANGHMTDLNKFLPPPVKSSGVVLSGAFGINDKGQIVGDATVNGHAHAYLLTPVS